MGDDSVTSGIPFNSPAFGKCWQSTSKVQQEGLCNDIDSPKATYIDEKSVVEENTKLPESPLLLNYRTAANFAKSSVLIPSTESSY